MIRLPSAALLIGAMVLTGLTGCGGDEPDSITVAAAASLTEAFGEIAEQFAEEGGDTVALSFDSSAVIADQVTAGAPIDVFASADPAPMDEVVAAGRTAAAPTVFARNRIVIVTPPGNPSDVTGLADLDGGAMIALCEPQAPCGLAADRALAAADVEVPGDRISRGRNVRETLRAVTDGGLGAGIVYATDAQAVGDRVHVIPIPEAPEPNEYLIVRIDRNGDDGRASGESDDRSRMADRFVEYVTGPEGRRILAGHGFLVED